jgi:hypothetical protein
VGIGATPSAWGASNSGNIQLQDNVGYGRYGYTRNAYFNGTSWTYIASGQLATQYLQSTGTHAWFTAPSGTAGNAISFTQAMTLDANGDLNIGTAAGGNNTRLYVLQPAGADRNLILAGIAGISNGFQVQYISGSMRYSMTGLGTGTVSSSGGILSASSDQNMKIADGYVSTALDKIDALTPRYFYWKDKDGEPNLEQGRQLGFFAQEVNAVIPEAAPAPKSGEDGWGVYDRGIVATLVKAIQEQQALITQLQADVAALKGAA